VFKRAENQHPVGRRALRKDLREGRRHVGVEQPREHPLVADVVEGVEPDPAKDRVALVLDGDGEVHQVTLLEKLLVPLLAKLGNLVIDGGIWMNTQRPEWNDANNALVGQGLSMVTLYYLRRYVRFLQELLESETTPVELSAEVGVWLRETADALRGFRGVLAHDEIPGERRLALRAFNGEGGEKPTPITTEAEAQAAAKAAEPKADAVSTDAAKAVGK
jgi:hypothetical protein